MVVGSSLIPLQSVAFANNFAPGFHRVELIMKRIVFSALLSVFISTWASAATHNILLTGYWPPTNEMLREFSPLPEHNKNAWIGRNWQGLGYDVYAYFSEFKENDTVGTGDFEVEEKHTMNDLKKYTEKLSPVAIMSFGNGPGDWEIERNFPDYFFNTGVTLHTSLPAEQIQDAVNHDSQLPFRAWINEQGDAGDYLCGYLSYLISAYHEKHSNPQDARYNVAAGFIHVSGRYDTAQYTRATEVSLRALITYVDSKLHEGSTPIIERH
jgi:hypothetical protein